MSLKPKPLFFVTVNLKKMNTVYIYMIDSPNVPKLACVFPSR